MSISSKVSLDIPNEHSCYPAHFPGDPIVPGALLLQWIIVLLKKQRPELTVSQLRTVKFLSVVKPGDDCQLNIQQNSQATQLKINLHCNGHLAVKGQFDIQPATKISLRQ